MKVTALFADSNGEIFDAPGFSAAVMIGNKILPVDSSELIPLPESADLMYLPNRRAIGFKNGKQVFLRGNAVSAILPVGYTRTFLPAYQSEKKIQPLPLYGYTAVVLYKDELFTTAVKTDENHKWDPKFYNTRSLKKLISKVKKDLPNNRLIDHLSRCSTEWHCLTAQNLFYHRWECGIPTSPKCNANCVGCLSFQKNIESAQSRIEFIPTADEIAEVGIYHLSTAEDAIVSFGQGCEGEPSLMHKNISEAIRKIRAKTDRGQINMNSNAGSFESVKNIIDAGLDSIRVSIISANDEHYQRYYRAVYKFDDVKRSVDYALKNNVYVSLNLLYFPGFNDRVVEVESWKKFLTEFPVQMIQIRNLNLDPEIFSRLMPADDEFLGTKKFIETLQKNFPRIQIGNFSHFVKNG